ncbi:MAG: hypothetical protein M3405_15760 [Acidobacteriota bacterium]|jgi:hypothetical protein|nr:hypothetical protein [Acidobacteriota bacterium]
MSKIIRWETPFTDAFYPSVGLTAIPLPLSSKEYNNLKLIVSSEGVDKYPKYLINFGEVIAFTCMDEGCCPERDFSSATFDDKITKDRFICSFQWLNSPWLKSYEGCHDPESEGKFSHYLIFGGDNNVEVITENTPIITKIEKEEVLTFSCKI